MRKFKFIFPSFTIYLILKREKSFYNVEYELVKFDFRCNLFFLSIFDDHKNEEVLNYSSFGVNNNLEEHTKKLVILERNFGINCWPKN